MYYFFLPFAWTKQSVEFCNSIVCVSLYKEGIKLRPDCIKSLENSYKVPYSNTI